MQPINSNKKVPLITAYMMVISLFLLVNHKPLGATPAPEKTNDNDQLNISLHPAAITFFKIYGVDILKQTGTHHAIGPVISLAFEPINTMKRRIIEVGAKGIYAYTGKVFAEGWLIVGYTGVESNMMDGRGAHPTFFGYAAPAEAFDFKREVFNLKAELAIGYQWIWSSGVSMRMMFGASYVEAVSEKIQTSAQLNEAKLNPVSVTSRFLPSSALTLGFIF